MQQSEAWQGYIKPVLEADLRADARSERRVSELWSGMMLTARGVRRSHDDEGGLPPTLTLNRILTLTLALTLTP